MISLLTVLFVAAEPGVAPPPPPPPTESATGPSSSTSVTVNQTTGADRPWRVRAGVLAGMVMQKPQAEIAVAYDFARVHKLVRLVADFTFGFRTTEFTLLPMVGARFVLPIPSSRVEVWVSGLVGANLTFLRGSTAVALPFRMGAGVTYRVLDKLAVGGEASVEVGPLVIPFIATYAAGHVTALAAWSL